MVPKPKAAWHHQSECVDEVGVGRWKGKNAARRHAKADALGVSVKEWDREGWSRCDGTTRHQYGGEQGACKMEVKDVEG